MTELTNPEDLKLVTLARGARGRVGAAAGASVRDQDGRTYSGASVDLATRSVSALELAVATALASGAKSLEAAVQVGGEISDADAQLTRACLQPGGLLVLCAASGDVISVASQ